MLVAQKFNQNGDYNQKPRPCGCKGCRTCLICESNYGVSNKLTQLPQNNGYVYCPYCNLAYPGWDITLYKTHPNHKGTPKEFPGVYIKMDYLSAAEEEKLLEDLDSVPWVASQSGRRKQNYGPKCNFKKKKLVLGDFKGFPVFSKFLQEKFEEEVILKGFKTIEQCSLEYNEETGASIDPHIDDCWIWGERVVTVNLLSDTVLTMTCNDKHRYNLDCVKEYPRVLDDLGNFNNSNECYPIKIEKSSEEFPVVRIPMPRRSLAVLYGAARYDWEHRVLRKDIHGRRIAIAYREFTPPYLDGGMHSELGKCVLEKAASFF